MTSNLERSNSISNRSRRASSRFEVERVEETELNSARSNPGNEDQNEVSDEGGDNFQKLVRQNSLKEKIETTPPAGPTTSQSHSSLKKTVTRYKHDDDVFNYENGESNRKSYLLHAREEDLFNDDTDDPSKVKDPENNSNSGVGCFQIECDEKNTPVAITCNLNTDAVNSYRNCVHDFKTVFLYQKLIAEFTGTMLLTLYACSIGLPIAESNVPSINGCLGGGLTLASLIWVMGSVSGGHFNPAVTLAFFFSGRINPLITFLYIGAQLVGAISGASILQSISPEEARGQLSVTLVNPVITLDQALGVEIIITFILVITVFSCVDSRRKDLHGSFPLQIGLAVAVGGLFGGRFTGGSMNPARSFGPAVVSGIWTHHWIYWIGPVLGGLFATFIYSFVLRLKCPRKPTRQPINYQPISQA